MKTALSLLLAMLVTAAPAFAHQSPRQVAINYAEDLTVSIMVDGYDEMGQYSQGQCTGVLTLANALNPTEYAVLTAGHCAREVTPRYVYFFDGDRGKVTYYALDKHGDLAMLLVHAMRRHYTLTDVNFTDRTPQHRTDQDFIIGSAEGVVWGYGLAYPMQGGEQINANDGDDSGPDWSTVSAYGCSGCGPGDSGAGMWSNNGFKGIVVGGNNGTVALVETLDTAVDFSWDVYCQEVDWQPIKPLGPPPPPNPLLQILGGDPTN